MLFESGTLGQNNSPRNSYFQIKLAAGYDNPWLLDVEEGLDIELDD